MSETLRKPNFSQIDAARAKADAVVRRTPAPATEAPTPQALPPELLPVEPLPMEALPDAFAGWVGDVSERMHCPPEFVAVPLLVSASSLVARHVGIRPQARTDWTERCNLWGTLVARPGFMKSPALAQAMAPMDRLEAKAAQSYSESASEHEVQLLAAKLRSEASLKTARAKLKDNLSADVADLLSVAQDEEAPPRKRYLVNDLSYEKLGVILSENPGGVLAVRDELRGLLLSLAGEDAASARALWLQSWSGGRYVFDRIGRGTVTIDDARLSMIGCIQPGPLCELVRRARMGAADDGMIERFLVSWPDTPGEWREVDRLPDSESKRDVWSAFDYLDELTPDALGAEFPRGPDGEVSGLPFLRFDDEAREAFSDWRHDFEKRIRAVDAEGLEGAMSKFRHHVPALALVLHVIDGGTGPVSLQSTVRALDLADYFESHARRLHSSGRRQTVRAARAILDKARSNGALPHPFTARDIYRKDWSGLTDRALVDDALEMLAVHGWVTETNVPTGGRPTTYYSLTEGARHG